MYEKGKTSNRNKSHTPLNFAKMGELQTRTLRYTKGGIMCLEGVYITCWPDTHAVN